MRSLAVATFLTEALSADLVGSRSLVLSPSHVLSPPRNLELSEFLQQLLGRGFGAFLGEGRLEPPGWEQIALGCTSRCELRLAQALSLRLLPHLSIFTDSP